MMTTTQTTGSELVGQGVMVVGGDWGGVVEYVTADGWAGVREYGTRRLDEVQVGRLELDDTFAGQSL